MATQPTSSSTLHPQPSTEIGYVVAINKYLASVNGLPNVAINEIVTTSTGALGLVTALKNDLVEVLMLEEAHLKPHETFQRTFKSFSLQAGDFLLGRIINPLGIPIDGKGHFPPSSKILPIEQHVRGINARQFIKDPFETGVTTVDMLVPVAKGQRELVIGDARSGKTSFIIDSIVNQKGKGIICVFAMMGRAVRDIRQTADVLTSNKASEYTCVVAASSSELASLIYLTPVTAITVAEYFQSQGKDVLLILDDLGAHAKFYREISLLGQKIPGRESYPGDIFYQHAKLLERAGCFNRQNGGGSITALPVIEVNLDDFTNFIPTNLMAMTDGHLMFNSSLYHQGHRPAIDVSLSVSRVGRQTQSLTQKLLADKVRGVLAEAKKLETLSRFGSEVSTQTQLLLKQNKQIEVILKQPPLKNLPKISQMVLLALTFLPFLSSKDSLFVEKNKDNLINFLESQNLKKLEIQADSLKDLESFFKLVENLIPSLEKVCQT